MTSTSDHDSYTSPNYLRRPTATRQVVRKSGFRKIHDRVEANASVARAVNETITPDHQEDFYLAGMNLIAEKFFRLAHNAQSDLNELRLYADLLLKHFEQKIKKDKIKIMGRHLELLEAKSKALETAVRNARSPAELGAYVREVLFPQTNGHKPETPLLLEEKVAS